MIIYNPLDGYTMPHSIRSQPRHCFLMTRLGNPVPQMVEDIRAAVQECCGDADYTVIDARARVSGRDLLLKIWRLIASSPLSVGIMHEEIPQSTQANIIYELGVAQALGKETVVVKSPGIEIPSDLVRTEYISFDDNFRDNFSAYLDSVFEQADYYVLVADQVERNPVLALDYLRRAFLINGDEQLREKAREIVADARLEDRAENSVEMIAASF